MEVDHVKLAMPISQFKYMPMYGMMVDNTLHTTALIGHNRHATKGAADNHAYAHPFQHEHINLMHNGSLVSHHHLTTETFVVDSEAICKALVTTSIEELVPKLRGAFALVWVDSKEQTLNFVRNDERPLSIAFCKKRNTIYWASEGDMLYWLLNREGITTSKVDYDTIESLPIGEVWTFPLTKNSVNIEAMTKTPVELAERYIYNSYARANTVTSKKTPVSSNTTTSTTPTKTTTTSSTSTSTAVNLSPAAVKEGLDAETAKYRHNAKTENMLIKASNDAIEKQGRQVSGFRTFVGAVDQKSLTELESRIGVYLTSFKLYKGSNVDGLGEAHGKMLEYPYCPVVMHAVKKSDFDMYCKDYDGLVTGYFATMEVPEDLKYRHVITDDKDLQRFKLNIKFGTLCALRTITDWACDKHPIKEVKDLHLKEVNTLPPFSAASAKKK